MTTSPEPPPRRPSEPRSKPELGLAAGALHLAGLAGFAIAQPLFDLLRRDATFFLARDSAPIDVAAVALGLALGPPLVTTALLALASLAGRARAFVHLALFALLASLACAPVLLRRVDADAAWVLGLAFALGCALMVAYRALAPVRTFASVLAPAPLVFAALFWFDPSIQKVRGGGATAASGEPEVVVDGDPAVVLVVLDELPMTSLVTPELEIDARLWPNFARLAAASTWFRNATASHEHTETAVPTILTGLEPAPPEAARLPLAVDYPQSLFTLLGASFRMRVHETFTAVCPPELAGGASDAAGGAAVERWRALASDLAVVYGHTVLPTSLAGGLPSITATWGDFGGARDEAGATAADLDGRKEAGRSGRAELVREFIASIDGASEPTLWFLHVLLPHGEWIHTPSGATYDPAGVPLGWQGARWIEEEAITRLGLQRHLLQLGFVDTLLGELIDRMQAVGVWERALVVVLADHGIGFGPGEYPRQAFKKNARKIAHVPFFVKRPGQAAGATSDRNVETVDVLPTIADVLGIDVPWATYGSSVFGPDERDVKRLHRKERRPLGLELALPTDWEELDRRVAILGEQPTRAELHALGGGAEWLGRAVAGVARSTSDWRATVAEPERWERVDRARAPLPLTVFGELLGSAPPARVAIAVNGIVRATAPVYDGGGGVRFACLLPVDALVDGANEVEVLGLDRDGLVRSAER